MLWMQTIKKQEEMLFVRGESVMIAGGDIWTYLGSIH